MHGDMSDGVKLAVVLIVCAFVLSIGVVVLATGQNMQRSYTSTINDVYAQAATSEIESIASYGDDIPAASLFIALSKDPGQIENISGSAYGITVTKIDDLKKLFKKQIYVTVHRNLDRFRIVISQ